MDTSKKDSSDLWEKIRQQYDSLPYPKTPIEKPPHDDLIGLYNHNIINAFYKRNKTLINSSTTVILDAACGSGYKTLLLAIANPGAKIVGFDLSYKSLEIAQARFAYHGLESPDLYCLNLYDLPKLGLTFDYINLDETLSFFEDIAASLAILKSVLKPEGIIRTNLHSYWQRSHFYRAQNTFKMMGMFDNNPGDLEVESVRDLFKSLKDTVNLKELAWKPEFQDNPEYYMMNFFLQGDKGYTIEQLFQALEKADLDFISMLNWREWDLLGLFKNVDDLPSFLAFSLPNMSIAEQLHFYEMLQPVHRLFDFWCGYPDLTKDTQISCPEWEEEDWLKVTVHLHPQLKRDEVKEVLLESIKLLQPFEISNYLPIHNQTSLIDTLLASIVYLPLFEKAQSMLFLIERWCQLQPFNPINLEPIKHQEVLENLKQFIIHQEALGYILLQKEG